MFLERISQNFDFKIYTIELEQENFALKRRLEKLEKNNKVFQQDVKIDPKEGCTMELWKLYLCQCLQKVVVLYQCRGQS